MTTSEQQEPITETGINWEEQLREERGKSLEEREQELVERLIQLLQRWSKLKTVKLDALLREADQNSPTQNEHVLILRSLIERFGQLFHDALKSAGIPNPLKPYNPKAAEEAKKKKEQEENSGNNEESNNGEDGKTKTAPRGYYRWGVKEFEKYLDKTVSYWTDDGKYGKGEIFIHPKRRQELCFRPLEGNVFLLTEGNKRRVTPEGQSHRFKPLKQE